MVFYVVIYSFLYIFKRYNIFAINLKKSKKINNHEIIFKTVDERILQNLVDNSWL